MNIVWSVRPRQFLQNFPEDFLCKLTLQLISTCNTTTSTWKEFFLTCLNFFVIFWKVLAVQMGFIPLYFSGITNIDNIWQHFVKGFSAHVMWFHCNCWSVSCNYSVTPWPCHAFDSFSGKRNSVEIVLTLPMKIDNFHRFTDPTKY